MSFFNRYQLVLMIIFIIFVVKKFRLLELFSQRSKCFSCEKELIRLKGPKYAALAQPSKCFDCEKQFMN